MRKNHKEDENLHDETFFLYDHDGSLNVVQMETLNDEETNFAEKTIHRAFCISVQEKNYAWIELFDCSPAHKCLLHSFFGMVIHIGDDWEIFLQTRATCNFVITE